MDADYLSARACKFHNAVLMSVFQGKVKLLFNTEALKKRYGCALVQTIS